MSNLEIEGVPSTSSKPEGSSNSRKYWICFGIIVTIVLILAILYVVKFIILANFFTTNSPNTTTTPGSFQFYLVNSGLNLNKSQNGTPVRFEILGINGNLTSFTSPTEGYYWMFSDGTINTTMDPWINHTFTEEVDFNTTDLNATVFARTEQGNFSGMTTVSVYLFQDNAHQIMIEDLISCNATSLILKAGSSKPSIGDIIYSTQLTNLVNCTSLLRAVVKISMDNNNGNFILESIPAGLGDLYAFANLYMDQLNPDSVSLVSNQTNYPFNSSDTNFTQFPVILQRMLSPRQSLLAHESNNLRARGHHLQSTGITLKSKSKSFDFDLDVGAEGLSTSFEVGPWQGTFHDLRTSFTHSFQLVAHVRSKWHLDVDFLLRITGEVEVTALFDLTFTIANEEVSEVYQLFRKNWYCGNWIACWFVIPDGPPIPYIPFIELNIGASLSSEVVINYKNIKFDFLAHATLGGSYSTGQPFQSLNEFPAPSFTVSPGDIKTSTCRLKTDVFLELQLGVEVLWMIDFISKNRLGFTHDYAYPPTHEPRLCPCNIPHIWMSNSNGYFQSDALFQLPKHLSLEVSVIPQTAFHPNLDCVPLPSSLTNLVDICPVVLKLNETIWAGPFDCTGPAFSESYPPGPCGWIPTFGYTKSTCIVDQTTGTLIPCLYLSTTDPECSQDLTCYDSYAVCRVTGTNGTIGNHTITECDICQ